MKTIFRLSGLLALCLLFASFGVAQKPNQKSPQQTSGAGQISQTVTNITVPVIISDKKTKQPVGGLAITDFEVFEDGVKQEILSLRDETDNNPMYIAVLMNTSPSTSGKLKFEKEAAKNFIYTVTRVRKNKVAFMTFDDQIVLHQDFTDKLDLLDRAVDKVKNVGNKTALYDAIYNVCDDKLRDVPTTKRAVVVITDGNDDFSRASLKDVIEIAQRTDTTIFAISTKGGFAGSTVPGSEAGIVKDNADKVLDDSDKILNELCEQTGGYVFYVGDMIALERAFIRISKQLRSQYVLFYNPKNNIYDGKFRKIEVKLVNPQNTWEIQHKKMYRVVREQQVPAQSQGTKVVDKMVATVSNGSRTDLITYSDVLWQIALEPNTSVDNPKSEDLNRALQRLIDIKLIEQEAGKLPTLNVTEDEITAERDRITAFFPSLTEFQRRLNAVGLNSTTDENFRTLIAGRVSINKYLDFRFRSFVVVTPKEEEDFYNSVYLPRFREQNPGRIVPTLEQARAEINKELTEDKIASDLDKFLESAREHAEIIILNAL